MVARRGPGMNRVSPAGNAGESEGMAARRSCVKISGRGSYGAGSLGIREEPTQTAARRLGGDRGAARRRPPPSLPPAPMTVVLLDPYHLGDPLFISQLARDVAARKEGLVFVHGSGEAGERALEGRGLVPEQRGGAWAIATDAEAAEVERATRDLNRRIVHEMNEAGVPAVRVMAADRGLVGRSSESALASGRADWLATLVTQGGVAVVASLVAGNAAIGAPLTEVDAAETAAVLAAALGAVSVVLLVSGRAAGIMAADGPAAEMAVADAAAALPDRALAERLVAAARVPVVGDVGGTSERARGGRRGPA